MADIEISAQYSQSPAEMTRGRKGDQKVILAYVTDNEWGQTTN
jgi:hypothetical protein